MRSGFDYMLLVGLLCLAPLLFLHCWDLLTRTDLKIFAALPVVSLLLFGLTFQISAHDNRSRCWWSISLLVIAAGLGLLAAIWFSPWLAWLSAASLTTGWMLERFGQLYWYRIVRVVLPILVFALAPIGDASDWTRVLEVNVAESSGALLDILGVPQLVTNDSMQLRFDVPLRASYVCRGLASPYLLLGIVTVIAIFSRRKVAVWILVLLTVPAWAWLGATLHMTIGAYAWDQWGKSVFVGQRNLLTQFFVLLFQLGSIWMLTRSLQGFLEPFSNYSATTSAIHKFFNWAVYWPARDPLRKRRALPTAEEAALIRGSFSGQSAGTIVLVVVGVCLVVGGGFIAQGWVEGSPRRLETISVTPDEFESAIQALELPQTLQAIRQLRPVIVQYDSSPAVAGRYAASWAFADGLQKVDLVITAPFRGFYPLEGFYLTPLSRFGEPRQSSTIQHPELGNVLVDQVVLLDELYGRSFLCYATFSFGEELPTRTLSGGGALTLEALGDSLALQPSTISVALFVEGTERLTEDQRNVYRDILLQFCATIREPLQQDLQL